MVTFVVACGIMFTTIGPFHPHLDLFMHSFHYSSWCINRSLISKVKYKNLQLIKH